MALCHKSCFVPLDRTVRLRPPLELPFRFIVKYLRRETALRDGTLEVLGSLPLRLTTLYGASCCGGSAGSNRFGNSSPPVSFAGSDSASVVAVFCSESGLMSTEAIRETAAILVRKLTVHYCFRSTTLLDLEPRLEL